MGAVLQRGSMVNTWVLIDGRCSQSRRHIDGNSSDLIYQTRIGTGSPRLACRPKALPDLQPEDQNCGRQAAAAISLKQCQAVFLAEGAAPRAGAQSAETARRADSTEIMNTRQSSELSIVVFMVLTISSFPLSRPGTDLRVRATLDLDMDRRMIFRKKSRLPDLPPG